MKRRFIDLPKELFKLPIFERALAALTYNKKPDQFFARLPPLYKSYSKNSIRKVVRNGIWYELDISDYMEWLVYYGILAEPRDSLYALLNKGDVVLDVGANIGEVCFNMAKVVGSSGAIHSFEPEPFIFSKLLENYNLNSFDNIHLNNIALGEIESEAMLAAQVDDNRGGTRIQSGMAKGVKVKVLTIDKYVSDIELHKLNLIKIDVEGFELKVLKGAEGTLRRFKPMLFIELNDDNLHHQNDSASALISYLYQVGYKNIQHAENKTRISKLTDFRNCHFDIIANEFDE
jgi:FkbM family methyltransferase